MQPTIEKGTILAAILSIFGSVFVGMLDFLFLIPMVIFLAVFLGLMFVVFLSQFFEPRVDTSLSDSEVALRNLDKNSSHIR